MLKRTAILAVMVLLWLAAGSILLTTGCGQKEERKKQVGPLKDWIVGSWLRDDDPTAWVFAAGGEFATAERVPIEGRYEVVEPDTIKISISGAAAVRASGQLGVPLQGENRNFYLDLAVKDDEMRPTSISSKTVFRKK